MMRRTVEAELLDQLPAGDPHARQSRRDLRRVNALMGHPRILARALRSTVDHTHIVELGAGDGTLLLDVARRLGRPARPVRAVLVDRTLTITQKTRAGFDAAGWSVDIRQSDVFEWLRRPHAECAQVTIANLFLHHFHEPALLELLGRVAEQTRQFIACEPRRSQAGAIGASLLRFVGCNHVTRHDARVSVRAGFQGVELSSLWPRDAGWHLAEGRGGPFTHTFVADHAC